MDGPVILEVEPEIHQNECGQSLCTKNVCNVFASRRVGLGCKDDDFLTLGQYIADGEFDGYTDARIGLQHSQDFGIFALAILFQFSSPDGEVGKESFYDDGGAFLTGDHRGSLQLARGLKVQSGPLWSFMSLGGQDVEAGEGA